MILLPTAYMGNIEYFKLIARYPEITIEIYEHYIKQSYRNRASIYGANGKLDLIVPVVKGKSQRKLVKDTQIANSDNWQKIHWRSIESAYRTSPYFEFYESEFMVFFQNRYHWLLDLNNELTKFILDKINLNVRINYTTAYITDTVFLDYRQSFDPRQESIFNGVPYNQVFQNKHGFLSNLSVIDLLFNLGPEAALYINNNPM
jgi:hypothetical protein